MVSKIIFFPKSLSFFYPHKDIGITMSTCLLQDLEFIFFQNQ